MWGIVGGASRANEGLLRRSWRISQMVEMQKDADDEQDVDENDPNVQSGADLDDNVYEDNEKKLMTILHFALI